MYKNKIASVFVYVLILITLSVSMAMVVVSNISVLENTLDEEELSLTLQSSFREQFFTTLDRTVFFNTDGGGFTDNFGCPDNIVMSGATNRTTGIITDYKIQGDEIFCRGSFNGENLDILFSSDFSTFEFARYADIETIQLSGEYSKIGDYAFSDPDSSIIEFNSTYYNSDNIDDNFNSDDFTLQNSDTTNYGSGIYDNDINGKIFGENFLQTGESWENIFWNNDKIETYISENPHNAFSGVNLLGTSTGFLHLNLENNIDLRITEFRKADFDQFYELVPIEKKEFQYSTTSSGYLQNDGTLSSTISGNEFSFDFENKYYAIFAKNIDPTNWKKINYYFETPSGEKIIIFPIKEPIGSEDYSGNYSYLAYKILINSKGRYIYKMQEIFYSKE